MIWKLWDKFSFRSFCALHKLRFDSWHNVHETWMRAYYPLVLPWIRLVHCIMNKLQAKYLSLFSVPIESCQTYDSDYRFLCARAVLIMRMLYMLFIFKVIAVYFKTICNSIFHKPTLSIPVSLPHSPFIPFSLTRFLQAANHRIHCNTCNYFLTINCYLATGPLEKERERERRREGERERK